MVSVSNGDGVPYCGFDSLPDDLLLRVLWCLDGTAECVRSAALSRRFFVLALSPSLYSRLELAACGPRFGAADLRRLCLRAGAGLRALSPPPHLSVVAVLAALRGEPGTSLDELSFLPADPADEQARGCTRPDAQRERRAVPRRAPTGHT